jgi:opacity protein-like surface antigen
VWKPKGNWADLRGSSPSVLDPGNPANIHSRIDAFGLFTGQVGYAWNNALLYVKGGAAVTDDRYKFTDVVTGAVQGSADNTRWGATVGAGVEYGFAPNWSAGIEYDHLFMGTKNVNFTEPTGAFFATERIKQDVDLLPCVSTTVGVARPSRSTDLGLS